MQYGFYFFGVHALHLPRTPRQEKKEHSWKGIKRRPMSWLHALHLPRTPRQEKKEHSWKGMKRRQMAACTPPTKDTKAAEELPLMPEVTKARVEDDDKTI
jgi:hypothetical protein